MTTASHTLQTLDRPLTVDDFDAFPDDGNRYEIIGGQSIVSPSPSSRHQRISKRLFRALDDFVRSRGIGEAFYAPLDVYLSFYDVVQPDLLVVLNERRDIIQDKGIVGAPDLVVEILSPSSLETDFLRKAKLYERSGVREYWIVNPDSEIVSVQLLENDQFALAGEFGRGDTLRSAVLEGFELEIATIFPQSAAVSTKVTTEEPQPTNDN